MKKSIVLLTAVVTVASGFWLVSQKPTTIAYEVSECPRLWLGGPAAERFEIRPARVRHSFGNRAGLFCLQNRRIYDLITKVETNQ